jgi:hypothetical protein
MTRPHRVQNNRHPQRTAGQTGLDQQLALE